MQNMAGVKFQYSNFESEKRVRLQIAAAAAAAAAASSADFSGALLSFWPRRESCRTHNLDNFFNTFSNYHLLIADPISRPQTSKKVLLFFNNYLFIFFFSNMTGIVIECKLQSTCTTFST